MSARRTPQTQEFWHALKTQSFGIEYTLPR
jgi:hypothetical protein